MAYTTKYRTTDKIARNTKNETAYIDVGDPYVKAIPKASRATAKQFLTEPPKNGQTGKYFSKLVYKEEPYTGFCNLVNSIFPYIYSFLVVS